MKTKIKTRNALCGLISGLLLLAAGTLGAQPGSIAAWGCDLFGEVSATPPGTCFIAIASGYYHGYALRADGSIAAWGWDYYGQVSGTPPGTGFIAIASGYAHGYALRADGSIAAWGSNFYGEVSGTPPGTGFIAIASGAYHGYALRADGSIAAWGSNLHGEVSGIPPGTGFIAIAGGYAYGYALRADGRIAAWGYDYYGQVSGIPPGTGFTAIAGGWYHGYALRADGRIAAWGDNTYGQVSGAPTGTGFTAIGAGYAHGYALRADGSIAAWASDQNCNLVSGIPTGTGFIAIAAGGGHAYALRGCCTALTPPTFVQAVSRKNHGGAGTFDIDLPLTGPPGIECRAGGATGDYTMVVTFVDNVAVTGCPQAEVICGTGFGTGSVSNVITSGTVVTIELTGIPQPPCGGYIVYPIKVRLNQVNGTTDFTIPMGVLIGDVNANGHVNQQDTNEVDLCNESAMPVGPTNFRCDLDADGLFCTSCPDRILAKCYSGSGLFTDPTCP